MYAHFALHKLKKFPSELFDLPVREQAFIFASIDEYIKKHPKK